MADATYYKNVAKKAAAKYGIDPKLFVRQIAAESNFQPGARSGAGAQGIAQIMPATAKGWGVDPNDPEASLDAAAKAMSKYVKSYGSYRNALVAYNAGPGRVGKPLYSETRRYVDKIMAGMTDQTKLQKGQTWTTSSDTAVTPTSASLAGADVGMPSAQAAALRTTFRSSSPTLRNLIERAIEQRSIASTSTTSSPTPSGGGAAAASDVAGAASGPGNSYRSLWTFLEGFGARLDNPDIDDLDNRQTIGGSHTRQSNHYAKRAIDLGDAKNDMTTMRRIAAYARRNPQHFAELYFNKLGWGIKNGRIIKGLKVDGHDDHMHLAVNAPPAKRKAAA